MKTEVTYDQLVALVVFGSLLGMALALYGITQIKRIVRDGLEDMNSEARRGIRRMEWIARGEEPLSDAENDGAIAAIAAMAQKIESLTSRIEELETGSSATGRLERALNASKTSISTQAHSPIFSPNLGESSDHASVDVPSNVVALRGKQVEKPKTEKAAAKSLKNSPISAKKQVKAKRIMAKTRAATVKKPQQPAATTSVQ